MHNHLHTQYLRSFDLTVGVSVASFFKRKELSFMSL